MYSRIEYLVEHSPLCFLIETRSFLYYSLLRHAHSATFSTPKCQIANPLAARLFRRPNGLIRRPSDPGRDLSGLFRDRSSNKGPREGGRRGTRSMRSKSLLTFGGVVLSIQRMLELALDSGLAIRFTGGRTVE